VGLIIRFLINTTVWQTLGDLCHCCTGKQTAGQCQWMHCISLLQLLFSVMLSFIMPLLPTVFHVWYNLNRVPSVLWHCWLGGRKGIWSVKKLSGGVLPSLSVWSDMQTCIWPSWCHCHSLSLASVKSRLVLPFWYRFTWVVPEKGPLNVCVCVCVCVILTVLFSRIQKYYLPTCSLQIEAFSALTRWLGVRKSIRPVKIEWWGVVVICLE